MQRTSTRKAHTRDRMRKEYRFDYSKARPNRFAVRKKGRLIVILDPDVSRVFKKPETVNNVLRALIATMPQPTRGKLTTK